MAKTEQDQQRQQQSDGDGVHLTQVQTISTAEAPLALKR